MHKARISSEKSFGYMVGLVFLALAASKFFRHQPLGLLYAALGIAFISSAKVKPDLLSAPNIIWFKFGQLLNKVISPIVMGCLFFFVFTPFALIARVFFGADFLKLKVDPNAPTYWIERNTSSTSAGSFKTQF